MHGGLNRRPDAPAPQCTFLFQILRVQALQLVNHKKAVFANQDIVEPDFAAAVFRTLNHHQIPVNRRLVAVWCIFVAHARRKMEASADFFVEKSVLHRSQYIRIDADGEFAEVAGTLVSVEKGVDFFVVVGSRLDDFALFDFKADVFVGVALLFARSIVGNRGQGLCRPRRPGCCEDHRT